MRRNDREITDIKEICDVLDRCTSINLGMNDGDYPYVIPMTFGNRMEDDKICVYFHCAGQGHKWEVLHKDDRVCVEAHIYERVEMTGPNDITARYESVIGFGRAQLIEDAAEKIDAIKLMLEHYNSSGFPATSCNGMTRVQVFKVVLDTVSGKRSKSEAPDIPDQSKQERVPDNMPGQDGWGALFVCPNCHKEFAKTSLFCPFCGTKLWDK